ncbi:MAG: hypothetical protein J6X88_00270, partial [Bacteroidales bacterium]|nr:hypothetical protein [Bacteroidales bacterium]
MNPYIHTDMKTKRLLTLAAVLYSLTALAPDAQAQTYDTIYNRAENCYYTSWYDTCECFLKGQRFQSLNVVTVSADPNSFAV